MSTCVANTLKKLNKLCYNQETRYLLNYLTLEIKDPEINKTIVEKRSHNYSIILFPTLLLIQIAMLIYTINQSFIKNNRQPMVIITSIVIFLIAIISRILIWAGKAQYIMYLSISYFWISVIIVVLAYEEKLPSFLENNKKQ